MYLSFEELRLALINAPRKVLQKQDPPLISFSNRSDRTYKRVQDLHSHQAPKQKRS